MKKITCYIFGQLFFTVIAITLVLTCIMWLIQTLRYIDLIASKGVPISLFFEMVGYLLPNIFVIIVPIAIFIGVIFIYNKLINDHELVVMRAAGLGNWALTKPTFFLSLVFTILLYFVTLYFLPFSFRKHRDIMLALRQESLMSLISVGQFNTFEKYTVYAHQEDEEGNLSGVLIYDAHQSDKPFVLMAEKGIIFKAGEEKHLLLMNGNRQEQDPVTGKPSILYFDRYVIKPKESVSKDKKPERFLKTHERDTGDLLNPKERLSSHEKIQFLSAAHQRLIIPLYAMAFGLLGACTMILGYYSRHARVGKIIIACLIAVIIEVGGMICLHSLHYGYLIILLYYALVIIPVLVFLFLLSPLPENLMHALRRRKYL